mmetsp:Transcript_14600/g.22662  ORF Transcript_14600/g.22662 Transcript_14600/m.22662 type:complete len:96 (+) Transcript_14600:16-303(+)
MSQAFTGLQKQMASGDDQTDTRNTPDYQTWCHGQVLKKASIPKIPLISLTYTVTRPYSHSSRLLRQVSHSIRLPCETPKASTPRNTARGCLVQAC